MRSSPTADRRFVFFGGKGGVGKSTCAAASARTLGALVVSLDPAHSLRDVLGLNADGKDVLELDARAEFREFMQRHRQELREVADRGTYFDEEDIDGFLDLSLPGLDEIAGMLKLGELARGDDKRVIVDLPPTGHALRLFDVATAFDQLVQALELMQDKHRFAVQSLTRRYARDDLDAFLEDLRASCESARQALFESGNSAFVLVARPEPMVLAETARYAAKLRQLGAHVVALVMNMARECGELTPELRELPCLAVPTMTPISLKAVGARLGPLFGLPEETLSLARSRKEREYRGGSISPLLKQPRRLMIFGGKGGVGKTTMAAATALALGRQDPQQPVVALSIDPAHSLGDSLEQALGDDLMAVDGLQNVRAAELDPGQHWRDFQDHFAQEGRELFGGLPGGGRLDPIYDRQIAAQLGEIQPTGLDEIAAATTLVDLLEEDEQRLIVVDSAPTGHLIRFLEAPALVIDWAKELMRILLKYGMASQLKSLSEDLLDLSRKTKRLQALLHDAEQCEVVVVSLPEPTVVAETARLIERLRDLNVSVRHVIVNQMRKRGAQEAGALRKRFPDLELIEIARRAEPIQGLAALTTLSA